MVFDLNGNPKFDILILLNGRSIQFINEFETKLSDQDMVSLIPLMGEAK